jgi:Fic family protein
MKENPKKWIWQHEDYPTFDYDPSALDSTLLDVSRNIGKLEGAIYALNEKNINDIMIDDSSNEILHVFLNK